MEDTLERIAIPLGIAAAVIGIWAALRNNGTNPATQTAGGTPTTTPALQIPYVAPLEETLVDPASTTGLAAGTNIGTSPAYTQAALAGQYSQQPAAPLTQWNGTGLQGSPAYVSDFNNGWLPPAYVSQMAPWLNGEMAAITTASGFTPAPTTVTAPGGGCGGSCGGSCGGGKSKKGSGSGNCPNSKNCQGFLDGAGAAFLPIYQKPIAPPAAWPNTILYSVETQFTNPAARGAAN
jgi:hypothetical protein